MLKFFRNIRRHLLQSGSSVPAGRLIGSKIFFSFKPVPSGTDYDIPQWQIFTPKFIFQTYKPYLTARPMEMIIFFYR